MAEKRFLDFLDRIDGGGMGQSGDTFEGGGLLSMLGNLFASPYGSQNPDRRARRDAFYAGQMGEPMAASGFNSTPVRTVGEMRPKPPTEAERIGLNPPSAYDALSPARDPYDMMENRYGPAQTSPAQTSPARDPYDMMENRYGPAQAPAVDPRPDALRQGMQPSAFEATSPARDLQDMQQRANYAPTTGTQADLFLASLRAQYGSSKANAIAKAPFALDLFKQYVNNNYQLPRGY